MSVVLPDSWLILSQYFELLITSAETLELTGFYSILLLMYVKLKHTPDSSEHSTVWGGPYEFISKLPLEDCDNCAPL